MKRWFVRGLCSAALAAAASCGSGQVAGGDPNTNWFSVSHREDGLLVVIRNGHFGYMKDSSTTASGILQPTTIAELEELLGTDRLENYYQHSAEDFQGCQGEGLVLTTSWGPACWRVDDVVDAKTRGMLDYMIQFYRDKAKAESIE